MNRRGMRLLSRHIDRYMVFYLLSLVVFGVAVSGALIERL